MAIFPLIRRHKVYLPIPEIKQSFGKVCCTLLSTGDTFTFSYNSQLFSFFLEKLSKMLLSLLASTLLLGSRLVLGQEDCTAFKEGACPLEESNVLLT